MHWQIGTVTSRFFVSGKHKIRVFFPQKPDEERTRSIRAKLRRHPRLRQICELVVAVASRGVGASKMLLVQKINKSQDSEAKMQCQSYSAETIATWVHFKAFSFFFTAIAWVRSIMVKDVFVRVFGASKNDSSCRNPHCFLWIMGRQEKKTSQKKKTVQHVFSTGF